MMAISLWFILVMLAPSLAVRHVSPYPPVARWMFVCSFIPLEIYFVYSHWSEIGWMRLIYEVVFVSTALYGAAQGVEQYRESLSEKSKETASSTQRDLV
jgi:hypothetical protein